MLTVRTDLGPKAAIRLANFEADGKKCEIQTVTRVEGEPRESKLRDYVYKVGLR